VLRESQSRDEVRWGWNDDEKKRVGRGLMEEDGGWEEEDKGM
jgi:hypothetical protein